MTTHQQSEMWKTPGPWLGVILGLGTPATLFAFNRGGWAAGLLLLALLVALAVGVILLLKGKHVARI